MSERPRDEILAKWRAEGADAAADMVERAYASPPPVPSPPAQHEFEVTLTGSREDVENAVIVLKGAVARLRNRHPGLNVGYSHEDMTNVR